MTIEKQTGQKKWQHSEDCMCRLRNIAMHDYKESVTTGQTYGQTDTRQSDSYVPLCFAGDTKNNMLLIIQSRGMKMVHIFLNLFLFFKHQKDSIPRNASVACKTKLSRTTKTVGLPDRWTDRHQTK